MKKYIIGVDFGTLSARALLVDADTGKEIASVGADYPHAVMDKTLPCGTPLPQGFALQHPGDYLSALSSAVAGVLKEGGVSKDDVKALGFDFTACTVTALDENGVPLCFDKRFENEPHAYVKLWKHNSASDQADRLTQKAIERNEKWIKRMGGKISPEWMFPKILETLENAPNVYENTALFCEAADWMTFSLTGKKAFSASFAGFKAQWDEQNGLPSTEYLESVDKRLTKQKLPGTFSKINTLAGRLDEKGAEITGLNVGTYVAVPQLDAHASIVGLGVTGTDKLVLILGTSAVHMVLSESSPEIDGICGYCKDSVVQGLTTYESGQICCGDHFDWFVKNCVPERYEIEAREKGIGIHALLRQKAQKLRAGESGLVALDWFNGNRSVLSNSNLTGAIIGFTLRTTPEEIYRTLIEATAFGTRVILENYENGGIPVNEIIAGGGIAVKDPMTAQIYADIIGKPIKVGSSAQSAALGCVMYAGCVSGIFNSLDDAAKKCVRQSEKVYTPIPENVSAYNKLYAEYLRLHDLFGRENKDIMKELKTI